MVGRGSPVVQGDAGAVRAVVAGPRGAGAAGRCRAGAGDAGGVAPRAQSGLVHHLDRLEHAERVVPAAVGDD